MAPPLVIALLFGAAGIIVTRTTLGRQGLAHAGTNAREFRVLSGSAELPMEFSMTLSNRAGLQVADVLARFLEDRALPGTGVSPEAFWSGFAALLAGFAPMNRTLLAT